MQTVFVVAALLLMTANYAEACTQCAQLSDVSYSLMADSDDNNWRTLDANVPEDQAPISSDSVGGPNDSTDDESDDEE